MDKRYHPNRSGLCVPAGALALALALLVPASRAAAQTWNELGDAGSLIPSAQHTVGSGPLTTIRGSLSSGTDIDLYCLTVTDPTNFYAHLLCTVSQDVHLWLFNASGYGVAHDDGCQASLTGVWAPLVPSAGTYYLAVGGWGALALNGSQSLWTFSAGNPIIGPRAPDGPGAALPLTGWSGGSLGPLGPNYSVSLNGATFCDQTTPSTAHSWGALRTIYR
ncbi:MAG TPA: hypothetical protein VMS93_04645 [Candidatus Saccharimonadales bacterium]|nr:hypothetical protein [Candidatus Saccharimonadales bacterium]